MTVEFNPTAADTDLAAVKHARDLAFRLEHARMRLDQADRETTIVRAEITQLQCDIAALPAGCMEQATREDGVECRSPCSGADPPLLLLRPGAESSWR